MPLQTGLTADAFEAEFANVDAGQDGQLLRVGREIPGLNAVPGKLVCFIYLWKVYIGYFECIEQECSEFQFKTEIFQN